MIYTLFLLLNLCCSALQDPRMFDVLGALMGIDISGSTRPEGSDELPAGVSRDQTRSFSPPPAAAPSSSSKPSHPTPPPAVSKEDVEMEGLDDEEAQAKKAAEASKKLGSEAYKKKEFGEAAKHFQHAWDTWPKDVTFLTNLGGE